MTRFRTCTHRPRRWLEHFPKAKILVSHSEYEYANGFAGQLRGYLPNRWPTWFQPTLFEMRAQPFAAFETNMQLTQDGSVVLVPTPGHTPVVITGADASYFIAGDVSYAQQLMRDQKVDGVSNDRLAARDTLARTLQTCLALSAIYLPSHDPKSTLWLVQRQPELTRS